MTSQKKIESNRRNAQNSTGPRTLQGKHLSSLNSLQQGLYATARFLRGEDRSRYEELLADLLNDYKPVGHTEHAIVDQIVGTLWRLQRTEKAEVSLLEDVASERNHDITGWFLNEEERELYYEIMHAHRAEDTKSQDKQLTLQIVNDNGGPEVISVPSSYDRETVEALQKKIAKARDLRWVFRLTIGGHDQTLGLARIDARRRSLMHELARNISLLFNLQRARAVEAGNDGTVEEVPAPKGMEQI